MGQVFSDVVFALQSVFCEGTLGFFLAGCAGVVVCRSTPKNLMSGAHFASEHLNAIVCGVSLDLFLFSYNPVLKFLIL